MRICILLTMAVLLALDVIASNRQIDQPQIKNTERVLTRFYINNAMPDEFYIRAKRAEEFFELISLKPAILQKSRFDFTYEDVFSIIEAIKLNERMEVTVADRSHDDDRYVAYHQGGVAYIISDTLDRSECDHINTLVHEYMHHLNYKHGDNRVVGKENSVPYYFGKRASELCEAGAI